MDLSVNALVGAAIRSQRDTLGITQDELAQRLGLSRPSIANIEKGRQQISVTQLMNLSAALGVPPQVLLPSQASGAKRLKELPSFPANATPQMKEWAEKLIVGRE
ncbi:helix-turn-helix domain-containing protein [Devosia salina]|uniref:Helix-turn-helix domain-containing protein n=2 Tax=Devosia salina TaxID=2860336 RepID=A0ABX8WJG7_9HYPH|nr:helix-turn-helix domain-containing protein [Devosia salina]